MWSIFPCAFIILHLVRTIYLLKLTSRNLALFGILFFFNYYLTFKEPPSHVPPHPIPLGHPSAPDLSILYHASNLDWIRPGILDWNSFVMTYPRTFL